MAFFRTNFFRTRLFQTILFLVLAVGLIFLITKFLPDYFSTIKQSQIASSSEGELRLLNQSSFEEFVANASVAQLLDGIDDLKDEPTEEIPVRLGVVARRIAISDQILKLNAVDNSHQIARLSKLERLIDRVMICLIHNIESDEFELELGLYSLTLSGNFDQKINPLFVLAGAVKAVSELKTANTDQSRIHVKQKLADAIETCKEDAYSVKHLSSLLTISKPLLNIDDHGALMNQLVKANSASTDREIKVVLATIDTKELMVGTDHVDIRSLTASESEAAANELEEKFGSLLSSPATVTTGEIAKIKRIGYDLLALGRNEGVADQEEKIQTIVSRIELNEQSRELMGLLNRSKSIGTPFEPATLQNFNKLNVTIPVVDKQIFLLVSSDRIGQCKEKLASLVDTFGRALFDENLGLAIIFFYGDESAKDIQDIHRFDRSLEYLSVYYLPEDAPEANEIKERFAIDGLPLIIYSRKGKVKLVAPTATTLEQEVTQSD